MAGDRFKLTFSDGSIREVTRRPIHAVRAEAILGPNPGTMSYVYATLWAADTGGKGNRDAFEAWLNDLDDFDRIEDGEVPADPPDQQGDISPS